MSEQVKWSNSKVGSLRQCSRKFFFAYFLANHGRKNKLKRKAFELKKMQNLQMWQGSVVDRIMEKHIIPDIESKSDLNFEYYAECAVNLAERRFNFSKEKKYLDATLSQEKAGEDFCILDTHEVNIYWSKEKIERAYNLIKTSILNIPKILMPDKETLLLDYLKSCTKLLPNVKNWVVKIESANVNPQFDLILFDMNWKPAIIDWKVSESWQSDYSKQLIIMGLVVYLKRLEKKDKTPFKYEDIKLYEVNLLKAEVKSHQFTESIVADIIDYIYLTSSDIKLLREEFLTNELKIEDFDTTDNQSSCSICNFKTLCSFLIKNKFEYNENAYIESI